MYGYIYKTTNLVNGKIYIGKKNGKFNDSYLGSGKLIKRAIDKYGLRNFSVVEIDRADSLEELNKKEIKYIKNNNSQDLLIGYNISNGGDGGDIFSNLGDVQKEKVLKKMRYNNTGSRNPNYGNGDKIKGDKNPSKRLSVRKKLSKSLSGSKNPSYGVKKSNKEIYDRIDKVREQNGFIPNQYTVNKKNWRVIIYNSKHKQIVRSKTECVRVLKNIGFSNKVCIELFDTCGEIKFIPYPQQSKVRHEQALSDFPNLRLERYKEDIELIN